MTSATLSLLSLFSLSLVHRILLNISLIDEISIKFTRTFLLMIVRVQKTEKNYFSNFYGRVGRYNKRKHNISFFHFHWCLFLFHIPSCGACNNNKQPIIYPFFIFSFCCCEFYSRIIKNFPFRNKINTVKEKYIRKGSFGRGEVKITHKRLEVKR